MTKKIVILERLPVGAPRLSFRYVLRADVPASRQAFYANANFVSAWSPPSPDQQDIADLAALRAGALVEQVGIYSDPSPDGSGNLAAAQAALFAAFSAFQSLITNETRWTRTGTFHDGTSWTAAGA